MLSAIDALLQNYEYVAVMCLHFDRTLFRELILYNRDERKHKEMALFLTEGKGSELLHLVEKENISYEGTSISIYDQGNVKASRKEVAPFLVSYFEL